MRQRVLSLALAGLAVLLLAGTAQAQTATEGTTAGRFDQIIGFAQNPGVPPVAAGTFVPQMAAVDPIAAALGDPLGSYVDDMQAWFATNFGYRPSKRVTFLLFSNPQSMSNAALALAGGSVDTSAVLASPSFLIQAVAPADGVQAGDFAILVNTDQRASFRQSNAINNAIKAEVGIPSVPRPITTRDGQILIQQSMARAYSNLMLLQTAGYAGPIFYREGFLQSTSFMIVPGTPQETGRPRATAVIRNSSLGLPSLTSLAMNWNLIAGPGGIFADSALGQAFLSTNAVMDKAGLASALAVLKDTASGEDFNTALQSNTGFTLEQLNVAYQSLIPPVPPSAPPLLVP